jgi:hypothetical protein
VILFTILSQNEDFHFYLFSIKLPKALVDCKCESVSGADGQCSAAFGWRTIMKASWTLHLARWIGGLSLALFVSSASHAAIFSFTFAPDSQLSSAQSQIGNQTAGFTNNFGIDLFNQNYDLVISIINVVDPSSIFANLMVAFDAGGQSISPLNVFNIGGTGHTIHISGITNGTSGQSASFQVQVDATNVRETPIPAAALLFGSGLAALGFTGRKKKSAQV